jgi:hypothetical protein
MKDERVLRGGTLKRGIIIATLAAGILALGAMPAGAQEEIDCAPFSRVQTYRGWGPAEHYGEVVTVSFSATGCTGGVEDGAFGYTLTGTATVYEGTEASGTPIAVEPFASFGSFSDPAGDGWPPPWWSCVESADITWQIPDVYSFEARASQGFWNLSVRVPGSPAVHWSHAGC